MDKEKFVMNKEPGVYYFSTFYTNYTALYKFDLKDEISEADRSLKNSYYEVEVGSGGVVAEFRKFLNGGCVLHMKNLYDMDGYYVRSEKIDPCS